MISTRARAAPAAPRAPAHRDGPGIGVDPGGKGIKIGAHLRRLRGKPAGRARGHIVGDQPLVLRGIFLAPIFRRARPRLAQHPQQNIPMRLRLRVAKAKEAARLGFGVDMRNAIRVPQDLGAGLRGSRARRRGRKQRRAGHGKIGKAGGAKGGGHGGSP
jgi:hypothetical protein